MTPLKIRVGKAIRRLRMAAGFSQETFAAKAGINRGYYGAIERGGVNVSLDTIEKIAKVLQVTVGHLLSEADRQG